MIISYLKAGPTYNKVTTNLGSGRKGVASDDEDASGSIRMDGDTGLMVGRHVLSGISYMEW